MAFDTQSLDSVLFFIRSTAVDLDTIVINAVINDVARLIPRSILPPRHNSKELLSSVVER